MQTATVTKRFVNVPTVNGGHIMLFEGTELALEETSQGTYEATITSGQQHNMTPLVLTKNQAAMWLVFRTAEALGYRPYQDRKTNH